MIYNFAHFIGSPIGKSLAIHSNFYISWRAFKNLGAFVAHLFSNVPSQRSHSYMSIVMNIINYKKTYLLLKDIYFLFPVVHEKIFIIFMVASLLHMLCRARVGCLASDVVEPVRTNKLVWILFFVAIVATVGLIVFFLRHRLLCRPLGKFTRCHFRHSRMV